MTPCLTPFPHNFFKKLELFPKHISGSAEARRALFLNLLLTLHQRLPHLHHPLHHHQERAPPPTRRGGWAYVGLRRTTSCSIGGTGSTSHPSEASPASRPRPYASACTPASAPPQTPWLGAHRTPNTSRQPPPVSPLNILTLTSTSSLNLPINLNVFSKGGSGNLTKLGLEL